MKGNSLPPEEASKPDPERTVSARIEALRCEIEADAAAASHHLTEIDALLKWKQLETVCQPARPRRRWQLVALLVLTMALASLIFFERMWIAAIDLDAGVSELSFVTSARHDLTFPTLLKDLTVSGASAIEGTKCAGSPETLKELWVSVTGRPGPGHTITPGHVELAPDTEVQVLHSGRSYRYQIKVLAARERTAASAPREVTVSFSGPARVRSGACDYEFTGSVPAALTVRLDASDDNDFTLEPFEAPPADSIDIPIRKLSLSKLDENIGVHPYARPLSNVLSGELYWESVGGASRKVRSGEHLGLVNPNGLLNGMSSALDQLNIRFTGSVSRIDLGTGDNKRSVMPTWFDWLTANHGLSTLWAAGLYAFGLVLAVYHWWAKSA